MDIRDVACYRDDEVLFMREGEGTRRAFGLKFEARYFCTDSSLSRYQKSKTRR